MASGVYANAKLLMATDKLGWVSPTTTFRAMLVTAAYTFNHVQTSVADISAFEVADASYARVDVGGRTASLDLGGNRALLDAWDITFPNLAGVTPGGAIVYKQVGGDDLTPGDDPLFCFLDFVATAASGLNFLVELDPNGMVALTVC